MFLASFLFPAYSRVFSFDVIIERPDLCSVNSKSVGKEVQTHHINFTSSPCVNMMDNNDKTQW